MNPYPVIENLEQENQLLEKAFLKAVEIIDDLVCHCPVYHDNSPCVDPAGDGSCPYKDNPISSYDCWVKWIKLQVDPGGSNETK